MQLGIVGVHACMPAHSIRMGGSWFAGWLHAAVLTAKATAVARWVSFVCKIRLNYYFQQLICRPTRPVHTSTCHLNLLYTLFIVYQSQVYQSDCCSIVQALYNDLPYKYSCHKTGLIAQRKQLLSQIATHCEMSTRPRGLRYPTNMGQVLEIPRKW